jgi:outer membrane protein assembly factor BamB
MANFWRDREARAVSDYWNAVTDGHVRPDRAAATDIDPTLLATIARIREGRQRHIPDPAFLDRLETTLMNAQVTSIADRPLRLKELVVRPAWLPSPDALFPRRWSLAAIATVGLVAVTLAVFFFSLRGSNQPAIVPVSPEAATPTAIPAPTSSVAPVTTYRGDAARTGVMPGPAPEGVPGVLWSVQAGDQIRSALTVGNGMAYVGSNDGVVHAIDTLTGSEVWTLTTQHNGLSPFTILDGDTVYTVGGDGMARALNSRSGEEIWRSSPDQLLANQMSLTDGMLLIGGQDAAYYGLNASDGTVAWRTALGAAPVSLATVTIEGTLYAGAGDGLLYALDTATGAITWTFATGFQQVKSLSYSAGTIYVGTGTDGKPSSALVAVDSASHEEVWRITSDAGSISAPAIYGDVILAGTPGGQLLAVSSTTGETIWTFDTGTTLPLTAAPAIVGDIAYVVSDDANLYAVDAATGVEIWRVTLDGPMNMTPAITGGAIYVGTWSGTIYALADQGETLATPIAADVAEDSTPVAMSETSPELAANPVALDWLTDLTVTGTVQMGLALAPDGSIWLADTRRGRFQIFNPDGTFRETWGEPGTDNGEFSLKRSNGDGYGTVEFAPDGSFFVLDVGNYRVQAFDKNRTFITAWGEIGAGDSQFTDPIGIALDPAGNVLVLDSVRGDVQQFSPDGQLLSTIVLKGETYGYNSLNDLATDAAGNLYTAGNADGVRPYNQVVKYDPEGNIVTIYRADSGPGHLGDQVLSVAVDAAGNVYAAPWSADPRIVVFAPDGTFLAEIDVTSDTDLPVTYGIVLDGAGGLLVSDGTQMTVARFNLLPPLLPVDEATPAA